MVAALDIWARVLWISGKKGQQARLVRLARLADPDPVRDQLRNPAFEQDRRAVQQLADRLLADQDALARLSPELLHLVETRPGRPPPGVRPLAALPDRPRPGQPARGQGAGQT